MDTVTTRRGTAGSVPPLRDGDRLDIDEFLRRYEADRSVVSAELLDGVVCINRRVTGKGKELAVAPISGGGHSAPQFDIIAWLGEYRLPLADYIVGGGPATIVLPRVGTVPEPDALLRLLPAYGGQSDLGRDEYVHGPPELLVEVSYTTASRDLGEKFRLYEKGGVREYLVWRTDLDEIEWFILKQKKYRSVKSQPDGTLRSEAFPGLWLDPVAMIAGDMAKVRAAVRRGLASPEHAAFVTRLQKAVNRKKRP